MSDITRLTSSDYPGPYLLLGTLTRSSPIDLTRVCELEVEYSGLVSLAQFSALEAVVPNSINDGDTLVLEDGLIYQVGDGLLSSFKHMPTDNFPKRDYHHMKLDQYAIRRDQIDRPMTRLC